MAQMVDDRSVLIVVKEWLGQPVWEIIWDVLGELGWMIFSSLTRGLTTGWHGEDWTLRCGRGSSALPTELSLIWYLWPKHHHAALATLNYILLYSTVTVQPSADKELSNSLVQEILSIYLSNYALNKTFISQPSQSHSQPDPFIQSHTRKSYYLISDFQVSSWPPLYILITKLDTKTKELTPCC